MKSRILGFIVIIAFCGGAFTLLTFGQRGGPPPQLPRYLPSDKKFDPHDLAGVWTRNSSRLGYGGGGTCPDCGDRGFSNDVPPFTPLGQMRTSHPTGATLELPTLLRIRKSISGGAEPFHLRTGLILTNTATRWV